MNIGDKKISSSLVLLNKQQVIVLWEGSYTHL